VIAVPPKRCGLIFFLAVALMMSGSCSAPTDPRSFRNIILISIDSLRADHTGCYGYGPPTTPALDAFAAGAVRFTDCSATSSWTLPSHASMFTGLYEDTHKANSPARIMDPKNITAAEILHDAGYDTAAIVCAPFLVSSFNINQGFAMYDEEIAQTKRPSIRKIKTSARVTEKSLKYLRKQMKQKRPFFLFVHYWDPHYDYNPPPEYARLFDADYAGRIDGDDISGRKDLIPGMNPRDLRHIVALYDGEIRYTDDHLKELLNFIDQSLLAQNTAVIITSDHGDEFLEHGSTGHTFTCYEELIHVPLLIRAPWFKPQKQVIDWPMENVDLFPTILALAGQPPVKHQIHGYNLMSLIENGETPPRETLYCETAMGRRYGWTGRKGTWSSLRDLDGHKFHSFAVGGHRLNELYNLKSDPGEKNDLIEADEEISHGYEAMIRRRHAENVTVARKNGINYINRQQVERHSKKGQDLNDQLKSLGYVQ